MPSCSKASRGLFVLLRVTGIFTGSVISPSPLLRQLRDRYAIRAGRNLPDKEFRYLRTVIVTAGVHPRFGQKLRSKELTPFLNVRTLARHHPLYIILRFSRELCFLVNSRLSSFAAASIPEGTRQALSRSYGRCFAEFLNNGYLAHLRLLASTTCVGYRYGHFNHMCCSFSRPLVLLP